MLDVILRKMIFVKLVFVIVKIYLIQNRKILHEKPLLDAITYHEITNRFGYLR